MSSTAPSKRHKGQTGIREDATPITVHRSYDVVLGQGARLALGTTPSRLPLTQLPSFFIWYLR